MKSRNRSRDTMLKAYARMVIEGAPACSKGLGYGNNRILATPIPMLLVTMVRVRTLGRII